MPGALRKLTLAAAGFGLVGLGALLYAWKVEPRRLQIRRFRVTVPDLPRELEGVRAAFVTDFHVDGPGPNRDLTRRALEIVAGEQPDLVFLGGDFFDHARLQASSAAFTSLTCLTGQTFAVLGNHDMRRGLETARAITQFLEERGVCVLRNYSVSVRVRDQDVVIAGVDDPYSGWADVLAALDGALESMRPLVLLAHAPTIVPELPVGSAGLILTGHTHGGQIRLSPSQYLTPLDVSFYLDRILARPLSHHQRGFHWVRGSLLFVSNGVGMTRWPFRLFSAPEVVFFELSAEPASDDAPCDSARRFVRRLS